MISQMNAGLIDLTDGLCLGEAAYHGSDTKALLNEYGILMKHMSEPYRDACSRSGENGPLIVLPNGLFSFTLYHFAVLDFPNLLVARGSQNGH